jgi:hypothetical protein
MAMWELLLLSDSSVAQWVLQTSEIRRDAITKEKLTFPFVYEL